VVVKAVVFDVGETLVDETRNWEAVADAWGVPRFTLMALVGYAIARGESHRKVREWLDIDVPPLERSFDELYPDAEPCLRRCADASLFVGVVGNMGVVHEAGIPTFVDFVASSERWGVEKPSPAFFERIVAETGRAPHEVAYVGDLVHNDIVPALAAGMVAVHIRRGPWGYVQEPPPEALRIRTLDEVPAVFE
jgi:FMN phosphatase YigB (HAD superfamily)